MMSTHNVTELFVQRHILHEIFYKKKMYLHHVNVGVIFDNFFLEGGGVIHKFRTRTCIKKVNRNINIVFKDSK